MSKVLGVALVVMVLLERYAGGPAEGFLAGFAAGLALVYTVARERRL